MQEVNPGESNCTQCHVGSTLDGTTQNELTIFDGSTPVTEYVPGNTYTVQLNLNSTPLKAGFSATVLDGTNTKAGSLLGIGIGGTQNFAAGGRDYVSHTSASNNSGGQWEFTWTAPATNVGNVRFYVASNASNNNNNSTGDVIFLSQTVVSASTADIEEASSETHFTAGYNANTNKLVLEFEHNVADKMSLNIVDMNGRSVFTYHLGISEVGSNKQSIVLPATITDGMYIVNFFVGNKPMSAKILIKK